MGLFKNITSRFQNKSGMEETKNADEVQQEPLLNRSHVNIHDQDQREKYVRICLSQMAEASNELETLGAEYNMLTSNLTDLEQIEEMAPELKKQVTGIARKVVDLEKNKQAKISRKSSISNEDYLHMERIASYMPEGLKKLKEAEEYRTLVKNDLARIDGEKQAYLYRKNELEGAQRNMKGLTAICLGSMLALIIILYVISSAYHMDVQIGYILAVLVAACALTIVFVKYSESKKELWKVEKSMNKLILLDNTVKIRYVNNTNLIDYLYLKYDVESSAKLEKLWKRYAEESKLREEEAQVTKDLDESQQQLVAILTRCKVENPMKWISQPAALYDHKELVEVRHGLIIQRQQLRKQMEYNAKVAQDAQDEIKGLVDDYPEYAQPILDIVSQFDQMSA